MLIRHEPDGSAIAIGQASHAWMSGQMAAAWAEPVPEVVRLAAEQHDIGWTEWDNAPQLNPETGFPYTFTELPRDIHVGIWAGAGEKLLSQSAYAALLVSMHGTGLYERYPPRGATAEEQAAINDYLTSEHAFQAVLRKALKPDPDTLRRHASLIAIWDWLSLGMCLDWAPRRIDGFTLMADTIEPWPFKEGQLEFVCEGRQLECQCKNQAELVVRLGSAPLIEVSCSFTSP